ncbi:unnamed protein product [Brassica oleracea]
MIRNLSSSLFCCPRNLNGFLVTNLLSLKKFKIKATRHQFKSLVSLFCI